MIAGSVLIDLPLMIQAGRSGTQAFESNFLSVIPDPDKPAFSSFLVDSLGKKVFGLNPVLSVKHENKVASKTSRNTVKYFSGDGTLIWDVKFEERKILLSGFATQTTGLPFELLFNQEINHATVLGYCPAKNRISLPCLIHLPDRGTFRVTADVPGTTLFFDGQRHIDPHQVSIHFLPPQTAGTKVNYILEVVTVHPEPDLSQKELDLDGYMRGFLNIFQMNPRRRMLANNSTSDPCAFTIYLYAEAARYTPPLCENLTAMDLVRVSLDQYLEGQLAYGMVGYKDNAEITGAAAWNSPYNSLDSYPSLLISACYYIIETKDLNWALKNFAGLLKWANIIASREYKDSGLIAHEESGNAGSWKGTSQQRPSNWWDTVGFGHLDAYANALAFRAYVLFERVAALLKQMDPQITFAEKAARLKAAYYPTFINSDTGLLAGWKSADGKLHDYHFTFIQGVAISYGLVNGRKATALLRSLLDKMNIAGFTDFGLGLPGNLLPIRKEDYTHLEHRWGGPSLEDGSDGFQIYENGGATSCYVYFTLRALQQSGMKAEAMTIMRPLMKSMTAGAFQGKCENGMSRDWKDWKGGCWGYEGFLVDNYLTFIAALNEKII
jgi:hypothetical protein